VCGRDFFRQIDYKLYRLILLPLCAHRKSFVSARAERNNGTAAAAGSLFDVSRTDEAAFDSIRFAFNFSYLQFNKSMLDVGMDGWLAD